MVKIYTPTPEEIERFALSRGDHNKIHSISGGKHQIVPGDWLVMQYFLNTGNKIPRECSIGFNFKKSLKPETEITIDSEKIVNSEKDTCVGVQIEENYNSNPLAMSMLTRENFQKLEKFNPTNLNGDSLTGFADFSNFSERDLSLLEIITKLSGDLSGNGEQEGLIEYVLKQNYSNEESSSNSKEIDKSRFIVVYDSMKIVFNRFVDDYSSFDKLILEPQIYSPEFKGNKIRRAIDIRVALYGIGNDEHKKPVGMVQKELGVSYSYKN